MCLEEIRSRMLSGAARPQGTPDFGLNERQRASLLAFLKSGKTGNSDASSVQPTLEALNCLACRERGALGGPDTARKAYFQGITTWGILENTHRLLLELGESYSLSG